MHIDEECVLTGRADKTWSVLINIAQQMADSKRRFVICTANPNAWLFMSDHTVTTQQLDGIIRQQDKLRSKTRHVERIFVLVDDCNILPKDLLDELVRNGRCYQITYVFRALVSSPEYENWCDVHVCESSNPIRSRM